MAHLDPDQVIGRLAGARLGRARAQAGEVCPDAEVLAAYADGGLAADEVVRLEAHLAGCAACRRFVAALTPEPVPGIAVEPVPAGAVILPFRQRRVFVWMAAAAGLLAAVTFWSVSRLSEPAGITQMASAPAERQPDALPAPPAVPAEAPAASTAAGSAAPSRAPRADALRPAAPAPGGSARQGVAEAQDKVELAKRELREAAQAAGDNEAKKLSDAAVADSRDQRTAQVTSQRPIASQTNTVVAGVSRAHGPLAQQASNVAQNAQNVAHAPPPPAAAPPAQRAATPAPAPATAPAPAPAAPARDRPAEAEARAESTIVTGGEGAGRVNAPADSRAAKAEPAVGFARTKEADAVAGARAAFSIAGTPPLPSFAEPDGRLRWRIAADGRRLESSSDGGATWRPRHTAAGRLRAGSAPSIDVAWAVGDGGLVLRFTVPGDWAAVTRPADVALVGVSATSATTARVTGADGRVFETSDGGRSWTPTVSAAAPR